MEMMTDPQDVRTLDPSHQSMASCLLIRNASSEQEKKCVPWYNLKQSNKILKAMGKYAQQHWEVSIFLFLSIWGKKMISRALQLISLITPRAVNLSSYSLVVFPCFTMHGSCAST